MGFVVAVIGDDMEDGRVMEDTTLTGDDVEVEEDEDEEDEVEDEDEDEDADEDDAPAREALKTIQVMILDHISFNAPSRKDLKDLHLLVTTAGKASIVQLAALCF
jgi:hypothetical protein